MSETIHHKTIRVSPEFSGPRKPHVGDCVFIWFEGKLRQGTITSIGADSEYKYCVSVTDDDGNIRYVWQRIDQLKNALGNQQYDSSNCVSE